MPYQPITGNNRAVPYALADQQAAIKDLSALTSGQISGTIAALKKRAEVAMVHKEASRWKASGAVLSASIPIPAGKTTVHVFVGLTGFYNASARPMSDHAEFQIRIEGTSSRNLPRIPDNMDTYHLLGQFSRILNVRDGQSIKVELVASGGGNPGDDLSMNWATLDILLAYV